MNTTAEFLSMAREIIKASQIDIRVSEFLHDSLLRPVRVGESHDDRVRTMNFLIHQGSLAILEDRFHLVRGLLPDWLAIPASQGFSEAFNLANEFLTTAISKSKFDHQILQEIGLKGELAFLEFLREVHGTSAEITHVSVFDDSLGFDITVTTSTGEVQNFEVKTTSRPEKDVFDFFLSRNEYQVAKQNQNWAIACMRIIEGDIVFQGLVDWSEVFDSFPDDKNPEITWASVKIKVKQASLKPYIL